MKEVWFAVEKDGSEWWYDEEPIRNDAFGEWILFTSDGQLFPGAIKLLTGRDLTWNDEPIKIEL